MNDPWTTIEALIVVRTYPVPSRQSIETSCTAAITREGEWVRLYPIPWRLLPPEKQFHKYEWVESRVRPARTDPRVESRRVDEESIRILTAPLSTDRGWAERRRTVMPLLSPPMCDLQTQRNRYKTRPTLGLVKPRAGVRFSIVEEKQPDWTEAQLAKLRQPEFWRTGQQQELEKIPYQFVFTFHCESPDCRSHRMMCLDWELAELYRNVRHQPHWRDLMTARAERLIASDLHFFRWDTQRSSEPLDDHRTLVSAPYAAGNSPVSPRRWNKGWKQLQLRLF